MSSGPLPTAIYSADLSEQFFSDLIDVCARLQCDPLDMIKPLYNESGLRASAHNNLGNASGIYQSMPFVLLNLGYTQGWQNFIKLSADQQLPYLEKYYKPHTGQLVSPTAVYMATFCPAWISHSTEPDFLICAKDGSSAKLNASASKLWYSQNKGFDIANKGTIIVQDLTDAIARADQGNRWQEICARLAYVQQDRS